jgi:hypothetical protein
VSKVTVTVVDFKPLRRNTLVGFMTARINEMCLTIRDIAIHEKGESRWVQLSAKPQITREGTVIAKDGKIEYAKILSFDKPTGRRRFFACSDRCFARSPPRGLRCYAGGRRMNARARAEKSLSKLMEGPAADCWSIGPRPIPNLNRAGAEPSRAPAHQWRDDPAKQTLLESPRTRNARRTGQGRPTRRVPPVVPAIAISIPLKFHSCAAVPAPNHMGGMR